MKAIPTGVQYWTESCPWCRGTGRHPRHTDGWYIDYHWQDGHESCGPYTEDEAVRRMVGHRDQTSAATLVGPNGQVYRVEGE